MKHIFQRGLLLTAFIFGLFFCMAAQSTQIVVFLNDGTEQTYNLAEADRLYFEDNTKLVIEQGVYKTTVKIPLTDIRKITCHETEGISEASSTPIHLFPNPVHDFVILHNLQEEQSISIYALDGRMVKSVEAIDDRPIDISDLPIGIYLVRTESQILKMIKL